MDRWPNDGHAGPAGRGIDPKNDGLMMDRWPNDRPAGRTEGRIDSQNDVSIIQRWPNCGPAGRAPGLRPLEPSRAGGTRDAGEKEAHSTRGHAGLRNRRREGGNVDPLSSALQAVEPVRGPLPGTSRPDLGLGPEDLVLRPPVAKARGTDNIHQVATSQPSLVNWRRGRVHSTAPGVKVRAGSRDAPAPRGAGDSRVRRVAALSACHRSIGVAITRDISIHHLPVPALPLSPRDGHRGPGRDTPVRQSDRQQGGSPAAD